MITGRRHRPSIGLLTTRWLPLLLAALFLFGSVAPVRADAPTAADFPEIATAYQPIGEAVGQNAVLVGDAGNLEKSLDPIPAGATIVAFEENGNLLYAQADLSSGKARRLLLLKPSIVLIDDLSADGSNRLLRLQTDKENATSVESAVKNEDGKFQVTITTADRVYRITLPADTDIAGRIAVDDADGKTIMQRRPLADGILPHGPAGMKLMERWDRFYRDGKIPPWDTGRPADDLVKVVEDGTIKKGRAIVLGSGSGTNAIYLAQQGFDVTAIDVSPTALGIAEAKAEKAGVKVRWMLADVLAPPDVAPFDFIFDRGCYHNVRYVDAVGFVESVRQLSRAKTQFLIISLNRDGPPGVREKHMRDDWSDLFEFESLCGSEIRLGKDGTRKAGSWTALLKRKSE